MSEQFISDWDISKEHFTSAQEEYDINLYEKILELRKFEIENFWKRAIFFWGTISLIYIAYFNLDDGGVYIAIIPLLGLLFNIIFSMSIRGSKYWQEHYEELAVQFEVALGFILFRHTHKEFIPFLGKKPYVLSKPHRFSVSKLTMLLSDLSTVLWLLIWSKSIIDIYPSLKFEFGVNSVIDSPTIFLICSTLGLIVYFIIFIAKGDVYHRPNKPDEPNAYSHYRNVNQ